MTEVKRTTTSGGGLGLFATRDFETGHCILPPMRPLRRLAPSSPAKDQEMMAEYFCFFADSADATTVATAASRKDIPNEDNETGKPAAWHETLLDRIQSVVRVQSSSSVPSAKSDDDDDDANAAAVLVIAAMIQAALCFAHAPDEGSSQDTLLQLYHPSARVVSNDDKTTSDERKHQHDNNNYSNTNSSFGCQREAAIVKLSTRALHILQTTIVPSTRSPDRKQRLLALLSSNQHQPTKSDTHHSGVDNHTVPVLQSVMLIWACNAFAGGRVYDTFSRINHSCNPNSVVIVGVQEDGETNDEKSLDVGQTTDNNSHDDCQSLRAATPIRVGEEITISYLGILLYVDTSTRQAALARDKFFLCACSRCSGSNGQSPPPDLAQSIPCPICHPRVGGDVARKQPCLSEDVQYDDDKTVQYVCPNKPCAACQFDLPTSPVNPEDTSVTSTAKSSSLQTLMDTNQRVVKKIERFLRDRKEATRFSESPHSAVDNDTEFYSEQLTQHLTLASSVLGAKHWATNLVMFILLDQTLSAFHAKQLTAMTRASSNNEDDDDDDDESSEELIAFAIDMLERIVRFVQELHLHLHMGHLLSHVIIGTSRALVGLGDVKSQKYAATWLNKIALSASNKNENIDLQMESYVEHFESTAMQKVVQTLQTAWCRSSDESVRAEKRARH